MSQTKKGLFDLIENDCDVTSGSSVVELSSEKKKRSSAGLKSDKEPKQCKTDRVNKSEKETWVLSSFSDDFGVSSSQAVAKKNYFKQKSCSKVVSTKVDKQKIQNENNDLWCDKYSPSCEVDLAVHKKKVAEVRDWLLTHLCLPSGNGILLLTGPPGCGKTATLRVLAKEIGVEIQEWSNPSLQTKHDDFDDSEWKNYQGMVHRQSQLKNFRDFFLRANKYPCLSLGTSDARRDKKIILIEDLPNVFYRKANDLHDIIGSYQRSSRNPMVFIISDSNSNDTNGYRLFPKDTIQDLRIVHISFNPASVTSLNKLAKEIISSESMKRRVSFQTPSKEVVDGLVSGCNGDIRGLINNLQFTCLRGSSTTFQKLKHTKQAQAGKKPGKRSSQKSIETQNTSSSAIGGKDTSLFLFRVLGKILYCKREESSNTTESSLPDHLKQHERLPLIENPESIFEKSHMSGENVNLYLHQNYLDFFNNIDDVCVALNYLSDADHLTEQWMHRSTLNCYSPSVAIRGLMFCNQGRAVNQTKNVWRPLHKPKWWEVFRQIRDNIYTAMELFKGYTRNSAQLHCEYIPYLALSDIPLRSPGQINYLQVVSRFSKVSNRLSDKNCTLQDKEIDDNELDCSQSQSSQSTLVDDKETLHVTQTKVDNDIQEFDSD